MNSLRLLLILVFAISLAGCIYQSQQYAVSLQPTVLFSKQIQSQPSQSPDTPASSQVFTQQPTILKTPSLKPTHAIISTLPLSPSPTFPKSAPDELSKYIGVEYPPLPNGFESGFERYILPDAQYPITGYGLDIVDGDEFNNMLWLSKMTYRDDQGLAHFNVVDIMFIPPFDIKGEVFVPDGCKYGKDGEVDPEILVTAILDSEADRFRYLTNDKILKAWRANRSKEAFEEISTEGIECFADNAIIIGQ